MKYKAGDRVILKTTPNYSKGIIVDTDKVWMENNDCYLVFRLNIKESKVFHIDEMELDKVWYREERLKGLLG